MERIARLQHEGWEQYLERQVEHLNREIEDSSLDTGSRIGALSIRDVYMGIIEEIQRGEPRHAC